MSDINTTDFIKPQPYGSSTDILLAFLYIILIIFGVPANLIAFYYFLKQQTRANTTRNYFKIIYTNITITDLSVCCFTFPMVDNLFHHRVSVLMRSKVFCHVWGAIWELLPFYSVFLVGILSLSRMRILVSPMTQLNIKHLVIVLTSYIFLLVLVKFIFYMTSVATIVYGKRDSMCYFMLVNETKQYYPIYTAFNTILLALPIIPICISCLYSIIRLYRTNKAVETNRKISVNIPRKHSIALGRNKNQRATWTVIIVTLVYIICNIPVFLNYTLYTYWSATHESSYTNVYNTGFLYWYSWNISLVFAVVLNATINPIVYVLRMNEFRTFVLSRCVSLKNESSETNNSRDLGME